MNHSQALDITRNAFFLITKSKTVLDLEAIPDKLGLLSKNRMNTKLYPKINFDIKPNEIKDLIISNLIDKELNIRNDITSNITDPMTKLLYAIAWKNGDLVKIKHIMKGILDSESELDDQNEALVFHQFGKYLTKAPGQPIVDQHVIRAFAIHCSTSDKEILTFRTMDTITIEHKDLITKYKNWLGSKEIDASLKKNAEYSYHVDKLLFAVGKTIKIPKKSRKLLTHSVGS